MRTFLVISSIVWATLLAGQRPELVVPLGHADYIRGVSFSPDGRYIVSGSIDRTVKLWSRTTGALIHTFETPVPVHDVSFSSTSGSILAISSRAILEWDLNTTELIRSTPIRTSPSIFRTAIAPDAQSAIILDQRSPSYFELDLATGEVNSFGKRIRMDRWARVLFPVGYVNNRPKWLQDGELSPFSVHGETGAPFPLPNIEEAPAVAFSKNGRFLVTVDPRGVHLWDVQNGQHLQQLSAGQYRLIRFIQVGISDEGRYVAVGDHYGSIQLWDTQSGQQTTIARAHAGEIQSMTFSNEGRQLASGSADGVLRVWDSASGKAIFNLSGATAPISHLTSDPKQEKLLISNWEGVSNVWDLTRMQLTGRYTGFQGSFHPLKPQLITAIEEKALLWDLNSHQAVDTFLSIDGFGVHKAAFSGDGQQILVGGSNFVQILEEAAPQKVIFQLSEMVNDFSVYPKRFQRDEGPYSEPEYLTQPFEVLEEEILVSYEESGLAKLQSLIEGNPKTYYSLTQSSSLFGPGFVDLDGSANHGELVGIIFSDKVARWDLKTGAVKEFILKSGMTRILCEPDGQGYVTGNRYGALYVYDKEFQLVNSIPAHQSSVSAMTWLKDGQFLITGSMDHSVKIWDWTTQELVATLYQLADSDWVVTDTLGLFDASPGAMRMMHFATNDGQEWEVINLEQLKARYYEPGLLQKLLGYSDEPIRPVENFGDLKLYPQIEAALAGDSLFIRLQERRGGIGKLSIFINGKEVLEEANPLPRRENAHRDSSIQVDLGKYQNYLFRHPDSTNTVSIRVYNEAGWLKSPAVNLEYQVAAARSRGGEDTGNNSSWTGKFNPKLYVISIGTSDYSGTKLDLQYGDQDATMMARALEAVGTALVEADSLEVHCLTTARADSTGLEGTPIAWHSAGKNDIRSVFEKIKGQAKAEDMVVVYLSGHGVTQGGTDQTLFYYLTKDIASEDALSDPATRRAYAISSEELTDWLKAIPAQKQVLIIDACNSGQIVENLTGGTKALNSSQIRALDRMKDRTGMFVLSGSAADKVSYEASEYGQGLLTYALLEGMRSATRSVTDGKAMVKMIDVMTLFQYARDRVPELATSINGIQTPMLGFPSRAASFDIGILNDQASAAIRISAEKPIVIRSTFLNEATYRDDLRLADRLEAAFREETKKGADADLVYVDVYDYPNAYSLGGFYRQTANGIELKLKLLHGEEAAVTLEVPVTEDPEKLVKLIIRAVKKMIP